MPHDQVDHFEATAAEARGYLLQLQRERSLAVLTGVADIEAYLTDIDGEIETWNRVYTVAAVTEIATLRAELAEAQLA